MHRLLSVVGLLAVLLLPARAQPTLANANFQVTTVVASMSTQGGSMAADRFGNVFILNQTPTSTAAATVTMVQPNGAIVSPYFGHSAGIGQLAYNPMDGLVYAVANVAVAPFFYATVYQLSVAGGVFMTTLPLSAPGFTIDNQGRYWLAGQPASPGSPGLYLHDPAGPPGNLTLISADNGLLQSMITGDVLILSGTQVRRLPFAASTSVGYFQLPPPMPNAFDTLVGVARNGFNELGPGAFIAVRGLLTVSTSTSWAQWSDPLGAATASFCSQGFPTFAGGGVQAIAAGPGQDFWWLAQSGITGVSTLYRIGALPTAGVQGSLLASTAPGLVTLHVYGPAGSSSPFVLGLVLTPTPVDVSLFAPPFGVIALNPFHPLYGLVLDGVGLVGPPSALGIVPPTGHFQLPVPIPGGLTGISVALQALVLAAVAPNGAFFMSNVRPITLP